MEVIETIPGIRCMLVYDGKRALINPLIDTTEPLSNGEYVFVHEDLSGGLSNSLGNRISIEDENVKKFEYDYFDSKLFKSRIKVILFKNNNLCNYHTYHEIRSLIVALIRDFRSGNVQSLLNKINACRLSDNNELLLFIKCCLLIRLKNFKEFKSKFDIYIKSGFSCFINWLKLLDSTIHNPGTKPELISVLHEYGLGDAFEYAVEFMHRTNYKIYKNLDSFVKGNKNSKDNIAILLGHGKEKENQKDGDEIKIKRYVLLKDIFNEFKNNNIKFEAVVVISCWTNQLVNSTMKFGIEHVIFHKDELLSDILGSFARFTIESLQYLKDVDDIFNYLKLSMFLYTARYNNLDITPD